MTNQSVIEMPARPRPVVRDPDAKRRHILEAARRLLTERGFQDIVLDEVAAKAGVAKGTLFLHFKNKDDLFSAVFSEMVDALGLELSALAKTGLKGKEMLVAAAKVILNHFDRNRDFMGQIGAGRLPGCCGERSRGRLMDKFRANHAALREILALASCDGARSVRDPDFAVAAFFGLCRSAAVRDLVHRREGALEREAERVVAFFLDGSGIAL